MVGVPFQEPWLYIYIMLIIDTRNPTHTHTHTASVDINGFYNSKYWLELYLFLITISL